MRVNFKYLLVCKRWTHRQCWIKPNGYDTGIVVYHPIQKQKVPLILKNDHIATWYMCGPTVYDAAHIGHAYSYMRFDIIRRILSGFFNIDVVSVMGITDVDDKIIMRSQGSSQFSDWSQLSKHYEQEFYKQMATLNILPAYLYCRVSDYVPQIIQFINKIINKNMAYVASDGCVYFNTMDYTNYGKFRKSEIESHSIKKSNLDFALWKKAKEGEPYWDSPWGRGRPGWHIECSTMGSVTLGSNIDIHSGGQDLVFPHHENEEAQSCCYHGTDQWINYWIHSGLLHLEDVKMSKSLQNTISIKELLEKYTSNQFRLFCLLQQHRTTIDFSHQSMMKAIAILKQFEYFRSDCQNYLAGKFSAKQIDDQLLYSKLTEVKDNVRKMLADDFSTSTVIYQLVDLMTTVNKMLDPSQKVESQIESRSTACIGAVSTYISKTLSALGITNVVETNPNSEQLLQVIDTFVKFRSDIRNKALGEKTPDQELLKICDDSRSVLAGCGIKVKDYRDKSTWTIIEE